MAFEDKMIVKFGFNPLDPKRIKEATSLYLKILQTENFAQIKRNIKNGYDRVHAAMVSYVSDLQQNIKDDANQSVLLTQGVDIYIGSDSNVEINPSARFNFRGLSEDNVETISQEHLVNCNELQESPLFLALTNNNIAIAEKILRRYQQKLQHISTVTKEFSFCFDIDHSNAFGETALFVAAARGHHQAVKLLLQLDASANKCRRDGLTPLHVAIAENQFEVAAILIQHLINKSASTRLMDDKGRTPIWFAVQKGCLSLVKTLWSDDDRKYTDKNGDNLLVIAAEFGQVELVKFFRDNQMSIDQTDDAGYTLVMQALKNQQITRAKILIQQGASVVKMGSDGATALKLAKN
ncbi:MAG: ankyrin repeat domain-containing protein [Coxiellaceae bacterium]|nr:MAG: ankyrin repeat domain-containing protein [Coxiellaceae bacterium]